MSTSRRIVTSVVFLLATTGSAWAQPLGTFRWQLQPYCNVVSVNVIGQGSSYTLNGTDDLCGAPQKASVTGLAFPNPDGTIGFGLTIVTPTAGVPVHVTASINLVTLGGTWSDSAGNTGLYVFTPGAASPGAARPAVRPSPGREVHSYDLEAAEVSAPITLPAGIPVGLGGTQLVAGFRGVAQASLLSIAGAGGFIEWVGLNSPSAGTITHGFNGAPGTLIVTIDWSGCVRVEVAGAAGSNQIQVRNACGSRRTGQIILTY